MADISKITLLDGTTYNFKDAEARNSIPDVATELPEMNGAAAVGTSEKYAKEDHVHPSDDNKLDNYISTASGNIVTFHDGADGLPLKKLVAQITSVQDLHGYDSPWPAGGGKNKFNIDGTKIANKYIAADGTYTNSDVACIYTDLIPVQPSTTYTVFGNSTANAYIRVAEYTSGDVFVTRSLSGSSYYPKVTFTTSATTAFLRISPDATVVKIQVEQGTGQTATPYTIFPYSNECPISGWTGLEGKRTGVNLFDSSTPYNFNQKTVVFGGTSQYNYNTYLKKGTYTISIDGVAAYCYCRLANGSNMTIKTKNVSSNTFTIDTDGLYAIWLYNNTDAISASDVKYVQIEHSTSASSYEAYTSETLSISWQDTAGTVYGGTMTVNEDGSGVLTVGRKIKTLLNTDNWYYNASWSNVFYTSWANDGLTPRYGGYGQDCICDKYSGAYLPITAIPNGSFLYNTNQISSGAASFAVKDERFSDVNSFKASFDSIQLVYELATPLTYTFSDLTQLTTLLGTNNIWVDIGDISVTYYNQNLDSLILNNIKALNGHTVNSDVPANAIFTDTTYESKTAASGGTDVSLVTTGEKATWNGKVNISQGISNAGKFLVVGSDGNVTTVTMTAWQGGSY